MTPATSERNFTPSSTALSGPPSAPTPGTAVLGQMVRAAASTVMPRAFVVVWAPALTPTVKFEVPVAVGVPEITPVLAVSASPAGSVPLTSDHVYGGDPPLAASVVE